MTITRQQTGEGVPFKVVADFEPQGDQPQAIEKLTDGLLRGLRHQVLLGVTGSGKTYTMAKVVERIQKPTIVIAPNKTLAAQLATEFREFFPHNAVEYFVSYYDYYQPEAYVPSSDTYIEKDSDVNDEIDKLRHAATRALMDAPRCPHRRLRLLHLRPWLAGRVLQLRGDGEQERAQEPQPAGAPAHRDAVRAQRLRPGPRALPHPGRHAGDHARL